MKKLFSLIGISLMACTFLFSQVNTSDFITTASGLKYKITQKTNGVKPVAGDNVQVHYTGRLENDTVFDSSLPSGNPLLFELGIGRVIKGWDEGIALLNEGEKAIFWIPSNLAYGERAQNKIPANSNLIFEVELVKVIKIIPFDNTDKKKIVTPSGLVYWIIEEGPANSKKSGMGKTAKVNYSAFFSDGKIFDSSVKRGQPASWELGTGPLKGFDEGISYMKVGDKYKLELAPNIAFGSRQIPNMPPNTPIYIDVELLEVTDPIKIEPFDTKGKDTVTTKSGLKYIVVKSSNDSKSKFGKTAKVHYTGYLEDGKIFDSSVKRGLPYEFTLGVGKVIPGWDEGVALMKKGEKFRFIIPYHLAYGEKGSGIIPPKATLIFDVELIDVGY